MCVLSARFDGFQCAFFPNRTPNIDQTVHSVSHRDRISERAHDALQEDFDDAMENYLQQNPGTATFANHAISRTRKCFSYFKERPNS